MIVKPQHTICIKNGHVFDPSQNLDSIIDIYIENDSIVAIGQAPKDFIPEEIIDASEKMIFPGFIDINAFLSEPGFTQKGTIASETQAAARSGITTICCTPNTKPTLDSAAQITRVIDKAKQAGFCNVLPIGALTANLEGQQLSNMYSLKDAGCIALSNHEIAFKDNRVIKQCYRYAAGFNITVMVTPLDSSLAQDGCMSECATSTKLGLEGISESAETIALAQHIILAKEAEVKLHISRVSSKSAVDMILRAKQDGVNITADVALGNLIFSADDCAGYNSLMHVSPVYRSKQDRQALLDAVNGGHLSICSNHFPQDVASKMAPFAASGKGINALDSFASNLLNLVASKQLTLSAAINAVSTLPAQQLNIEAGSLKIKGLADLCIADLNTRVVYNTENLVSKGMNSPWLGQTLMGKVVATLRSGHIVYQD
ncbi:MAG: dihydroorotase [Bermanella sp.]|jgi:dihydroorotase